MPCPRCIERGQTWQGDPPKCAFETGVFVQDNWNCATLNALRETVSTVYSEENRIAVIPNHEGDFVLLFWYKSRGQTIQAMWVDDEGKIHELKLEQAEALLSL